MKFRFIFILFILGITTSFQSSQKELNGHVLASNYTYYSDYFVFIADDGGTPLVIPMDINWSPINKGFKSEFKGWYGTEKDWPIAYFQKDIKATSNEVPQESWQHGNNRYFQFDAAHREIIATINYAPKISIAVPEKSEWVAMPTKSSEKEIYAFRTTAKVKKNQRKGWMIYERIRWDNNTAKKFGDFGAFFWIPLVIDGAFYHFEQHKGKQTSTRWTIKENKVIAETQPGFMLTIIKTTKDAVSKRKNIPDQIQLTVPKWNLDISLNSGGSQVGHGEKFPNGLAYYRQSLLQSTKDSKTNGYGMLELILEND